MGKQLRDMSWGEVSELQLIQTLLSPRLISFCCVDTNLYDGSWDQAISGNVVASSEVVGRNDWRNQKMLMVEQNVGSMWLSIAGGEEENSMLWKNGSR